MKNRLPILILIIIIMVATCSYEPISMPNNDNSDIIYNTGEERYIPLNPEWGGSPWNFESPTDIFISQDEYIYVADSGNAKVYVLAKNGQVVESDGFGNDFSVLQDIPKTDNSGNYVKPTGLCVDSKLNLFIVDNTKNIYVWNQYINNIRNSYPNGRDSIAASIVYINDDSGEEITVYPSDFYMTTVYEINQGFRIKKVNFVADQTKLDSLYNPHVFYTELFDPGAEFVSVSAVPFKAVVGDNQLYACDRIQQRIASIYVGRSEYLKLKNGQTIWQHRGYYYYNIATAGTGAGTVNEPKGITIDDGGAVYYTQLGENFGFHKINYPSESIGWTSSFALNKNEIMDLYRFNRLFDVAIESGDIFVVDNGLNEVHVYDNTGSFVRKAGTRFVQTDTTLVDSVLIDGTLTAVENDTILTTEYSDVLNFPTSVAVKDGIVYIVDTGNKRILRYQLSTGLDIDLDNELGH